MSYYAIVLFRLSATDPEKEESFKLRISSAADLLGNVREMIVNLYTTYIENENYEGQEELRTELIQGRTFYERITDPFNIPNAYLGDERVHNSPEGIFILGEKTTSYDFDFYIEVQPYTGQELEFVIHEH